MAMANAKANKCCFTGTDKHIDMKASAKLIKPIYQEF